jgi:hypothetical protein
VFGAKLGTSRLFSASFTPANCLAMTNSKPPALPALAVAAALALAALAACSTVDRVRGKDGASTEVEARNVTRDDPLARPIQVGWTSARASYCGFVFNPDQLRSDFLASEVRAGATPGQMQKIERAYDYTRESVLAHIKNDPRYCNKERNAAIRRDLNRYLSGDYSPNARMAQ